MSEKFKLTESEINKTLIHSPYALSDSPYQSGLGAGQIKKYFYDFIRFFAKCLNEHLGEVGADIESLQATATEAGVLLNEVKGTAESNAKWVQSAKGMLEECTEQLMAVQEKAVSAYNLALGKSKVHIFGDFMKMFYGLKTALVNKGDFVLIMDSSCPDFVITSLNPTEYDGVLISERNVDEAYLQAFEPEVGQTYVLGYTGSNPVVLTGIESGIDTSEFATSEALDEFKDYVYYHTTYYESKVDENIDRINGLDGSVESAQEAAQSAQEMAQAAYDLASGNSKVLVFTDFADLVTKYAMEPQAFNTGDMLVLAEKNEPDFIVFSTTGAALPSNAETTEFKAEDFERGDVEVTPTVGHCYRIELPLGDTSKYLTIIGIESGIDTSELKTQYKGFSNGETITVADNTMYTAAEPVNELMIVFPKDSFTCGFQFTLADSGTVGVAFDTLNSPFNLKFIGEPPVFANGETWELNICNGVVVGGKIE